MTIKQKKKMNQFFKNNKIIYLLEPNNINIIFRSYNFFKFYCKT